MAADAGGRALAPALALACALACPLAALAGTPADTRRIDGVERVYVDAPDRIHLLVSRYGERRWRPLATTGAEIVVRTDAGSDGPWAEYVPARARRATASPLDPDAAPVTSATVHVGSPADVRAGLGDYPGVPSDPD